MSHAYVNFGNISYGDYSVIRDSSFTTRLHESIRFQSELRKLFDKAEDVYQNLLPGTAEAHFSILAPNGISYNSVRIYDNGNAVGENGRQIYFYEAESGSISLIGTVAAAWGMVF